MIYLTILVICCLSAICIVQMIQMRRANEIHERKMEILRQLIVNLAGNSAIRSQQLQLSEELKERLRSANNILSRDISVMVKEFVEILSANNLLR